TMITHPVYHGVIIAVLLSQAFAYTNCNNTYTNGIGIECFPCEPGYTAIEDCPGNYTSTKCEQCQDGTYQPECVTYNKSVRCRNCTVCDVYKENCTVYKDAVCELQTSKHDSSDDSGAQSTLVVVLIFISTIFVILIMSAVLLNVAFIIAGSSIHKVDGKDLAPKSNNIERRIAVVSPHIESKSNDCKEVENTDYILLHRTRESVQVTGDSENTQVVNGAEDSENKRQNNQLCQRTKDESLSPRDLGKGAPGFEIDWTQIFLQLSKSLTPTRWELFAYQLLNNCQNMARSVHDTVAEIDLEAKNKHTEGWVIHAYIKVFNKWLDNVGRTNATFEHIKDAVSATIEAKEASDLVLYIERNPPIKVATPRCPPLVPNKLDRTFGSNIVHSQQCMALHDDEVQGNSNCSRGIFVRSTRSYQSAHFPSCSRRTTKEISNQEETVVQLIKNSIETEFNCDDTNIADREQIRKRKQDQSTTQQNKMIALEEYFIRRFKDDLKADSMPILQNDYKMFMDFVIDLISNECHVSKEIVLSITYEGFCKAHQTKTKENETLYIIKSGKTSLCIGKEVFDDLAVYGNVARPKLLKHLDEKKIECDNTTLLFIKFEQMKNKDVKRVRNNAEKENNAEQNFQVNCQKGSSIESCPDMNECEEHFNIKQSLQQNSSDQLFDSEKSKRGNSNNNTLNAHDLKYEEKIGTAQVQHGKKQETEKNKVKDDKRDIDIETELDSITEWFFPVGNEIYNVPNADNVAETLNKFVHQDLNNTPSDSACQSQV
ncbi:uncharacterized protein LOC132734130, partial [Ruditapes philippinarum]|uniref:uncharacterized protein LOC132734130 n=1 Tax=Ruditapes philippinarum TaxID=129788 RepID=UPI00295AB960